MRVTVSVEEESRSAWWWMRWTARREVAIRSVKYHDFEGISLMEQSFIKSLIKLIQDVPARKKSM